jgi:hypothetical protein
VVGAEELGGGAGEQGRHSVIIVGRIFLRCGGPEARDRFVSGKLFHNGKHVMKGICGELSRFGPDAVPKRELRAETVVAAVTLLLLSFEVVIWAFPLWHAT